MLLSKKAILVISNQGGLAAKTTTENPISSQDEAMREETEFKNQE
jgi:hypothetical protein